MKPMARNDHGCMRCSWRRAARHGTARTLQPAWACIGTALPRGLTLRSGWLGAGPLLPRVGAAPPRRLTDTALTALQDKLQEPHGFAGYNQSRVWLAEEHHEQLSSSRVHARVRDKLRAKPKRPRPSHVKKASKR
jgi:hypothetical protein